MQKADYRQKMLFFRELGMKGNFDMINFIFDFLPKGQRSASIRNQTDPAFFLVEIVGDFQKVFIQGDFTAG